MHFHESIVYTVLCALYLGKLKFISHSVSIIKKFIMCEIYDIRETKNIAILCLSIIYISHLARMKGQQF